MSKTRRISSTNRLDTHPPVYRNRLTQPGRRVRTGSRATMHSVELEVGDPTTLSRGFRVIQRLLKPIVDVREEESIGVLLMFSYSFLAMTCYNILKPITRSKFIASLGSENLPYVLLVAGVLIGDMHRAALATAVTGGLAQ